MTHSIPLKQVGNDSLFLENMMIFHRRPTTGVWHLCLNGLPQYSRDCNSMFRIGVYNAEKAVSAGSVTIAVDPVSRKQKSFPVVKVRTSDLADLVRGDDRVGRIGDERICEICMRTLRSHIRAVGVEMCEEDNESVDYTKPIIFCVNDGKMYQTDECTTLASTKALAKKWAAAEGRSHVVYKPCSTFGPAKPKIVETKHSVR